MINSRVFDTLYASKQNETTTDMPDHFSVFDLALKKRGRAWRWQVSTITGDVVMSGVGFSRPEAVYSAYRALFLLLQSAPVRDRQP